MDIISCHSPKERCGVREYGLQLDRSFATLGLHVHANSFADGYNIVQHFGPNRVLLIHYEPGLVPSQFGDLIREARRRGTKIVACCHLYDPNVGLRTLEADVLVAHRQPTQTQCLPNTVIIPLGCPVYEPKQSRDATRQSFGFAPNDVVLTTLGFLTQWKNFPSVLEAMRTNLGSQSANIRIVMQTPHPFNPASGAAYEEARIRAIIQGHPNLPVRFSTEFLPEHRLLELAYASDVGFVYHGIDTFSVSAATKQFIAARCPLVVTSSTHSSDVAGGSVHRVSSFDVQSFAKEVLRLASDPSRLEALRVSAFAEYDRLNMNSVARQYIALFERLGVH